MYGYFMVDRNLLTILCLFFSVNELGILHDGEHLACYIRHNSGTGMNNLIWKRWHQGLIIHLQHLLVILGMHEILWEEQDVGVYVVDISLLQGHILHVLDKFLMVLVVQIFVVLVYLAQVIFKIHAWYYLIRVSLSFEQVFY